jgi:hypothetical protein
MSKTTIKLWATIDAEMDDDSASVLGQSLCALVLQHLVSQDVPVDLVTATTEHE